MAIQSGQLKMEYKVKTVTFVGGASGLPLTCFKCIYDEDSRKTFEGGWGIIGHQSVDFMFRGGSLAELQ